MRLMVNLDRKHQNYISLIRQFMHKYCPANTQIVICYDGKTRDGLALRAQSADVDGIVIMSQATLAALEQEKLGRKKATLDDWAGSNANIEGIPAIYCFEPVRFYTTPWVKKAFGIYIKKLVNLVGKDLSQYTDIKFSVPENKEELNEFVQTVKNAALVAIDIETNSWRRITCIGYSCAMPNGEVKNYVVDLRGDKLTQEKLLAIKAANETDTPKVFHNGVYDNQYLVYWNIPVVNYAFDTEYMQYALYEEMPRTLAFVAGLYCEYSQFWKHTSETEFLRYNALDCQQTLFACINMLQDFPEYAQYKFAQIMAIVPSCIYTSMHGLKVDVAAMAKVREEAEAEVAALEKELQIMLGAKIIPTEQFSCNSPKQVAWLMYDILGAKPVRVPKKKGLQRATDTKAFAKLRTQHPLFERFINIITTIRKKRKAISTYFNAQLMEGRLLYSYRPDGAETGRLSCKQSNFGNVGTQVQNIPFYAKHALVADNGYVLAESDKSQAEARITAYFADDEQLISALESDRDFYKTCGTLFFDIPYDEVSKDLRNKVIKRIIHGTNYMMKEDTFIDVVGASELRKVQVQLNKTDMPLKAFAKYLLSLYHKAYPKVQLWYADTKKHIAQHGYLESPLGWRRYFFSDISADATLRSAVAHQPQNLNVHLVNKAFAKVFWHMVVPSHGEVCLIAQVHDSILCEFVAEKAKQYQQQLISILENEVVQFPSGKVLRIPVDGSLGKTWAEVK